MQEMAQSVRAARVLASEAGILTGKARVLAVAFGPQFSTPEASSMASLPAGFSADLVN